MYEVLAIGAVLGGKLAGTITDQLNWALMGIVFLVAASSIPHRAIASMAIAAAITAFHLWAAWEIWTRAGVADASTVFTVVFTKAVFACVVYGLGKATRRVFAHQ